MQVVTARNLSALGFSLAAIAILASGYMQVTLGLKPCPLCIVQRLIMVLAGAVFLISLIHQPKQLFRRIYGGTAFTISLIGVCVAGWQVWLEHLPAELVPSCGPGLNYIFQTLPLFEAIKTLFIATGDCAEVTWTFLSLSIATWTMVIFVILMLISGLLIGSLQPLSYPSNHLRNT